MRITIEPTNPPSGSAETVPYQVAIEHPYDELDLNEIMRLWACALMACGYSPEGISEWIEGEEPYRVTPATGDAGGTHGETQEQS